LPKSEDSLIVAGTLLGSLGLLFLNAYASPPLPYDRFGVRMIYPTRNNKETYLSSASDIHDIFVPVTTNNDGTFTIDADATYPTKFNGVRMGLYAPNNEKWHNQEITGFFKTKSHVYPDTGITLYGRSFGRHSSSVPCMGTGYKGTITFDGKKTYIKKEVWHNGGYTGQLATKEVNLGDLTGKWIGIKFVIYDVPGGGVKSELYIDPAGNGDNWTKTSEIVDSGGLMGDQPPAECTNPFTGQPRRRDEILTGAYDGKDAVFRIDNAVVDFKLLSAREIITSP
jgi:hypothetical protein